MALEITKQVANSPDFWLGFIINNYKRLLSDNKIYAGALSLPVLAAMIEELKPDIPELIELGQAIKEYLNKKRSSD